MTMESQTFKLFQPRTGLCSFVIRYAVKEAATLNTKLPDSPLAIVFAHSTSNNKEQWEPLIDELHRLLCDVPHEMWALDLANHGQSAAINRTKLAQRTLWPEDHADLLRVFIQSEHLKGKPILAVGHSSTTSIWTMAIFQSTQSNPPILAFISFEPVHIIPPIEENDARLKRGDKNLAAVKARKVTFDSAEDAASYTRKRYPYQTWDQQVFDAYMKYGFESVEAGSSKIQTSCTVEQELPLYAPHAYVMAGQLYGRQCELFNVHLIFGERSEQYSKRARAAYHDGQAGRTPKSVRIVPGTGHMLVQEKPKASAQAVADIIQETLRISKSKM